MTRGGCDVDASKELDDQKGDCSTFVSKDKDAALYFIRERVALPPMAIDQQHQLDPIVIRSTHDPPPWSPILWLPYLKAGLPRPTGGFPDPGITKPWFAAATSPVQTRAAGVKRKREERQAFTTLPCSMPACLALGNAPKMPCLPDTSSGMMGCRDLQKSVGQRCFQRALNE